ncbi:MAG: hypothetical protein AAF985_20510 [Bacteroidota bacterium]
MENIFAKTQCLSAQDIQRYLNAELSKSDQHRIERHLLDCPLCSAAVEGLANEHDFEEHLEFQQIQEAIISKTRQSNTKVQAKIEKLPTRNYRVLFNRIAAAILFCILTTAAYLNWQENEGERLFYAYHQGIANDALIAQRAAQIVDYQDPEMKKGIEYFNLKSYRESMDYFQVILEKNAENPAALFFTGLAALELGKYAKAAEHLALSRINHKEYYEQATWYLILAELKQNNQATVMDLLEDLSNSPDSSYRQKAMKLKAELSTEQ